MIREGVTELFEAYYNGSFSLMACDSIRSTGMALHEVKEMLAAMRLVVRINAL